MAAKHILLLITVIAMISYVLWEYYVFIWARDISGAIIRVDLLLIWPGLLALFISTAIAWYRDRK